MPVFSPDIERALQVAQRAHAGQTRKGCDVPYVVHPAHVAMLLARVGADEVTIQAGLLHDVVEDCDDWTLERLEAEFGPRVCGIVAHLTEDKTKTWPERKQAAIDHVAEMSEEAVLVKAADKLHNLSSLLADLRAADAPEDVWRHFNAPPAATLTMARGLVEALDQRLEGDLISALRDTLEALEGYAAED
jgi:(p)ppGpp synthase/HD superfamily hydrolase